MEKNKLNMIAWHNGMSISSDTFKEFENSINQRFIHNIRPFITNFSFGLYERNNDLPRVDQNGLTVNYKNQLVISPYKGLTLDGLLIIEENDCYIDFKKEDGEYYLLVRSGILYSNLTVKNNIDYQTSTHEIKITDEKGVKLLPIKNYYKLVQFQEIDFHEHLLLGKVTISSGTIKVLNYLPPCIRININKQDNVDNRNNLSNSLSNLKKGVEEIYQHNAKKLVHISEDNRHLLLKKQVLDLLLNTLCKDFTFINDHVDGFSPYIIFEKIFSLVDLLFSYMIIFEKYDSGAVSSSTINRKELQDRLKRYLEIEYDPTDLKNIIDQSKTIVEDILNFVNGFSFEGKDFGGTGQ